jgi:transcriptional regulator with PAS, ATPase and Fis domain
MSKLFQLLEKVADTRSTVLILGESGTGKELIARAVHALSGCRGPFVPVNCGAIPDNLLESELFGYEKGAFTGAVATKPGRFVLADGGTIFLDEIGEMSPHLQVKLLRVLQEKVVEPVGGVKSKPIDVRVIAATNVNLREHVKRGLMREDLYYRLQVVPVDLPALRNRITDIPLLVDYFAKRFAASNDRKPLVFSTDALQVLLSYRWPGNIRELENLIERLSILVDGDAVYPSDLPPHLFGEESTTELAMQTLPEEGIDFNLAVEQFENTLISQALQRTQGNKKAAARLLNLNRTTLVEKIKKKGLIYLSDEQEGD